MKKYFVEINMGYAGTDETDVIEAESAEEAWEEAWERACENIDIGVQVYDPETHDGQLVGY